jgi:hypothetical protein
MPERVDEVLREFKERAAMQQAPTLEELVGQWSDFVGEVENGYSLSIYDYTNDLSVRDLLAELVKRVDRKAKDHALSLIAPCDERFRFATRELAQAIESAPKIRGWWWHRIPCTLKGELRADLEQEGLI